MKISIRKTVLEKLAKTRKMSPDVLCHNLKSENSDSVTFEDFEEIKNLADTLIMPLSELFKYADCDLNKGVKVCKKDSGYQVESSREGSHYYTYQHLATSKTAPELMALKVILHCDTPEKISLNSGHASKELIYILKGNVRADWQFNSTLESTILNEGDSFFVSPNLPHSFVSLGGPAELLAFNY